MSLFPNNMLRIAARSIRGYSTTSPGTSGYLAEHRALQHHASATTVLWRRISFYVCVPAVAVCVAWVYNVEAAHADHQEHLRAENDGHLPEIPHYDFMNRRVKPYPWGMNSLFFNPHVNKDLSSSE